MHIVVTGPLVYTHAAIKQSLMFQKRMCSISQPPDGGNCNSHLNNRWSPVINSRWSQNRRLQITNATLSGTIIPASVDCTGVGQKQGMVSTGGRSDYIHLLQNGHRGGLVHAVGVVDAQLAELIATEGHRFAIFCNKYAMCRDTATYSQAYLIKAQTRG